MWLVVTSKAKVLWQWNCHYNEFCRCIDCRYKAGCLYLYDCSIVGVKNTDYGDVTARKEFREKKQCKSFKWYLENIYPESNLPLDFFALGEVSQGPKYIFTVPFGM